MLAKIDKKKRELFEKVAAETDITCQFYTMENNENMIQVYVTDGDRDITPFMAYCLGRSVQIHWEGMIDKIYKK